MWLKRWLVLVGIVGLLAYVQPGAAFAQPDTRRIVFPLGASSAAVHGQVEATGTDYWVLTAQAGQTMSANLSFASGQAILIVWGADGTVLFSDHAESSTFTGVLPVTQDYFIAVRGNPNSSTVYTLNINIPPLSSPLPQAKRIQMAPGASAAAVSGQVGASGIDNWVLSAQSGQTLSASLSIASGRALLIIYGTDGTVLLTDHAEASTFTGALPKTQDYIISVRGYPNSSPNYTLTINIPPLFTPPSAKTISFAPGATSATVQGQVAAGSMERWTLRAEAGQTMTAQLAFSTGQAILIVWGADGTVLLSDHVGVSAFNGILPFSQSYNIDVRGNPNISTSYSLTVSIPPISSMPEMRRIEFAPGADSAAVQGLVAANSTNTWVLNAQAGQTMSVQIVYSTQPVVLSVTAADGTVLLSEQIGATSYVGVLPKSQDYIVTVKGNPSIPASYTLTVTIPPL
jgi:hypothetical protein